MDRDQVEVGCDSANAFWPVIAGASLRKLFEESFHPDWDCVVGGGGIGAGVYVALSIFTGDIAGIVDSIRREAMDLTDVGFIQ